MATVVGKIDQGHNQTISVTWSAITEADTGGAVDISQYPDRTVQVNGDFTTSGAITIEGSLNGTDYGTLHDFTGLALVLTDASVKLIAENPTFIRPRATAGASVSMNVVIRASK